jgi:hypothetical protein
MNQNGASYRHLLQSSAALRDNLIGINDTTH